MNLKQLATLAVSGGLVVAAYGCEPSDSHRSASESAIASQTQALTMAPVDRAKKALALVAARGNGRIGDLEVLSNVAVDGIARVKVLDKKTQKIETADLDAMGREAAPGVVARVLDRRRGRDFVGSVEATLARKVAAAPSSTVDAIIWAKSSRSTPAIDRSALEAGQAGAQIAANKSFHKESTGSIRSHVSMRGGRVTYQSEHAPLVAVSVPASLIDELSKRNDVDVIYQAMTYKSELNASVPTIGAPTVWARGYTGSGVTIGVVEADAIYFGHDWLADGSYYQSVTSAPIGDHASGVAGIIASTGSTYKGVAYGAPALLSANSGDYSDAKIIAATDWAISQGARVLNFSFGVDSTSSMTALDRYVDYITRSNAVTTVKSAGNTNTCPDEPHNVTSPGKGWNILTVGNLDDHGTAGVADDTMSDSSCYSDPASTHGDREKPEIAAPGTNITTTYCTTPSTCTGTGSGTSFAAPHVAGCAALMMQRSSGLRYWPEAVRALLMASAVENVEGDARLSDKDGVGGVDCSYADNILTGATGMQTYGYFTSTNFPLNYTFSATAGQTVRVVVAWDSEAGTGSPPTTDVLKADLDLTVYDSSGSWVGGSGSWDNSYEIVEFTAPATGTYSARISAYRFDGSGEYLGFAAWTGTRKK